MQSGTMTFRFALTICHCCSTAWGVHFSDRGNYALANVPDNIFLHPVNSRCRHWQSALIRVVRPHGTESRRTFFSQLNFATARHADGCSFRRPMVLNNVGRKSAPQPYTGWPDNESTPLLFLETTTLRLSLPSHVSMKSIEMLSNGIKYSLRSQLHGVVIY